VKPDAAPMEKPWLSRRDSVPFVGEFSPSVSGCPSKRPNRKPWRDPRPGPAPASGVRKDVRLSAGHGACARGAPCGAGRTDSICEERPFARSTFFSGIARNLLKSPESDEGIQENPRNPREIPRESKKIQARFLGFSWSGLGSAWGELAERPADSATRTRHARPASPANARRRGRTERARSPDGRGRG
jgi:hypothetical protein